MHIEHPEFQRQSLEILPKRNEMLPLKSYGLTPDSFRTNCYQIAVTQKSLFLYQYYIHTDPEIPSDSTKVWYKLVKNIESKLEKWIGLISHRSNTLWGNKYLQGQSLDLVWISKYKTKCTDDSLDTQSNASSSLTGSSVTQSQAFNFNVSNQSDVSKNQSSSIEDSSNSKDTTIRYKQTETKYRVSIKLTNKLDLKTLLTDEKEKGKIIQIINIKIKDKLESLGYLELGKGRFYEKNKFQQDYIEEVGLQVLRGFRFSLMNLSQNRLCLQIDPCTRILQSQNLLEVIQNMGKQAHFKLKGAVVISRYGNYKTYKIDSVEYKMTPASFFFIHQVRKGKKPGEKAPKVKKTYAQYFKEAYGITIHNMKQPLVKIYEKPIKIIKREKIREKPTYIFLIPELLSLTGMTIRQKNDKNAMKAIAPYTKLTPKARFIESQKLIHQIQAADKAKYSEDAKEDFSMIKIKEPTVVKGYILNPVYVTLKDTQMVQNGEFNIRQPLLNPAKFTDWVIFCSNGTKPEKIKEFIHSLDKASKQLGIEMSNPFINVINYSENDRDFMSKQILWLQSLQKQLTKGKPPQIIVLYLQSYQENFYSQIKREVINRYGVTSQVVKAATFEKQIGTLTVSTGIIVQMNQKIGQTVWKVQRNHVQFRQKKFQVFSGVKKPKIEQSVDSSMISETSSKKSENTDKSRIQRHNRQKKERKEKRQHRDKKDKKDKKNKKQESSNESKQEQGDSIIQRLSQSQQISASSFSKNTNHKISQVNDLSQSVNYPASFVQFGSDISSIQYQNESSNISKVINQSKILEKIDSSKSYSADSSILEVDESSQFIQQSQDTHKKDKKDKKQRKQKKEKKEKKQRKDPSQKTQEKKERGQTEESSLQESNNSEVKTEKKQEEGSDGSRSQKSGKHKKERRDKKDRHDKKDKHDKKQKHDKKTKIEQEKTKAVPQKTRYEDILIKKQQKKMAQAKKKMVDEKTKLQLTSQLEIACAGFSSSTSSANGKFTMSFVGTTNKEQSEVYTHCRYGMRRKDYLPDLEFQLIFNYWLRTYYEKSFTIVDGVEKHFMPSVLVIYREGLSEDQLKKQIYREVRILKKVIRQKVPKNLRYDPQIIYLTVNKRVNTRFFDNGTKDPRNANEGSVVFDEFARNNTMDFHLISQHVQNSDGTAVPTQYRIVYRNRFELSEAALAQFTYEQCHNYYNWAGSVRIPAPLQCAGKLSRLVGEKVRENVFKIGRKKKTNDDSKGVVPAFKFLDNSSVSSIGNETVDLMKTSAVVNNSMSNSFSLFNNTMSLTSSLAQSNLTSSVATESKDYSLASSIATSRGGYIGGRGDKKFDRNNNNRTYDRNNNRTYDRNDKTVDGKSKVDQTVDRKPAEQKPERIREIIDTFFFL